MAKSKIDPQPDVAKAAYHASERTNWPNDDQPGRPDHALDALAELTASHAEFFRGTFRQSMDVAVTSDGATITLSLERIGGGDLTMQFSDGLTTLVTPPLTIPITPGTMTVPGKRFVYIPQSTKVLTESLDDWPATDEHIKIWRGVVNDASYVQTNGALGDQVIQDHMSDLTALHGHFNHVMERLRAMHSCYHSGLALTITVTPGSPDVVDFALTAGVVRQIHKQSIGVFDTASGDDIHVVNDSVSPYSPITDLADITEDANGDSLLNRYYSLYFWMTINQTGVPSHVMCNLPNGSYATSQDAIADVQGLTEKSVPAMFRGISALLYRLTFRYQSAGGGDFTLIQTEDLREELPSMSAGGGVLLTQTTFPDSVFRLFNDADNTKRLALALAAITASTTRTWTVPDADVDLGAFPNALLANMAQATVKGREVGAGTGKPTDLTAAQLKTIVDTVSRQLPVFCMAIGLKGTETAGGGDGDLMPAWGETPTNKVNFHGIAVATDETVFCNPIMPITWNASAFTGEVYWTILTASTGDCKFEVNGVARNDGTDMDGVALGTAQSVEDTRLGQRYMHRTAATSVLTLSGSGSAKAWACVNVKRVAPAGSDISGDIYILGVLLTPIGTG